MVIQFSQKIGIIPGSNSLQQSLKIAIPIKNPLLYHIYERRETSSVISFFPINTALLQ